MSTACCQQMLRCGVRVRSRVLFNSHASSSAQHHRTTSVSSSPGFQCRAHCVALNPKNNVQQQLSTLATQYCCLSYGAKEGLPALSRLKQLAADYRNSSLVSNPETHDQLLSLCDSIDHSVDSIARIWPELAEKCTAYDPYPGMEANGLRSILSLIPICGSAISDRFQHCTVAKTRSGRQQENAQRRLNDSCQLLTSLSCLLAHVKTVVDADTDSQLIAHRGKYPVHFLEEVERMNREAFYGSCVGFQYESEVRRFLSLIVAALATMGRTFFKFKQPPTASGLLGMLPVPNDLLQASKQPHLIARWFLDATHRHDVAFSKQFWSIPEAMKYYSMERTLGGLRKCSINKVQRVEPEILYFTTQELHGFRQKRSTPSVSTFSGSDSSPCATVAVPPPVDESGKPAAVTFRHMQPQTTSSQPSPTIVIHFHGGGFIAQTSKTHQIYLTHWANELQSPVISVDYSLAPECPFPRAVSDCFYAYCWVLKHHLQLGSSAERIVLVGDSAGGNFVFGVAFLAAQYGLPVPDLLLAAYPALHVELDPSPGRLQSVMDPLLPYGVLAACLEAYRGAEGIVGQAELNKEVPVLSADVYRRHRAMLGMNAGFLSPTLAPDEMLLALPEVHLMPCTFDPLVDDSVVMARRLHSLGKAITLHPVEGLCHGFLNFYSVSKQARQASQKCVEIMRAKPNAF